VAAWDWIGLDWIGLDWIGLERKGKEREGLGNRGVPKVIRPRGLKWSLSSTIIAM
jgi:hypothetical protein